jgi:hypothetical protein
MTTTNDSPIPLPARRQLQQRKIERFWGARRR